MESRKLGNRFWGRIGNQRGRQLRMEPLEDRRMLAAPQVTNVFVAPGPVAIGQNDWYTEVDPPTAIVVSFDEELSTVDGEGGAASVINPANWQLTRDEVDVSGEIAGIVQAFHAAESRWEATLTLANPLADGVYVLTLKDDVTDLDGEMLDGNGDNAAGGDFVRNFVVAVGPVKSGDEFPVNTHTTERQLDASIAMDSAGNFVLVWASFNQDGGGFGVYGQRYNAAGEPQGDEFLVNTTTDGNQGIPAVAMDEDGDFVVIFDMSNVGGGNDGLYMQRYNAAGEKQGGQVRITEEDHAGSGQHDIAMDADGNFVVTWRDFAAGETAGIFAQAFNALGLAQTTIFRVNTVTTLTQEKPAAAMDADGNFAIVWQSQNQDGDDLGVFGQRYNALGVAQGSEFPVNTFTAGEQSQPDIGMDGNGDYVVGWFSEGGSGGAGVYGQRFSSDGLGHGEEFFVGASNAISNTLPAVARGADGGFVVTYGRHRGGLDGRDVVGRRFSSTGEPVGEEFEVNTFKTGNQDDSALAMHPNGNFVVAWESENQDGNNFGIYAQQFVVNMPESAGLVGDYNGDGFVNAADFVVWRDTLGSTINLAANGDDTNNVIDEADYGVWVDNFGGAGEAPPMPPALVGDYNNDGAVNAVDYTVWRDTLGSTTNLTANGDDSNNVIDEADYAVWHDNFGGALGAGSGARGASHVGGFFRNAQPSTPASVGEFFQNSRGRDIGLTETTLNDSEREFSPRRIPDRSNSATRGDARMLALLDWLDSMPVDEEAEFSGNQWNSTRDEKAEREEAFAAWGMDWSGLDFQL